MATETRPGEVEFGPFTLDLQTGELTRSGHKLRLQGQSFQILAMLLQQPGQVVTREALRQRLWSDETHVDFDQGLNNAIKRLRESLGDSAGTSKYIETVPRLGYRFIGAIKAPVVDAPGPPSSLEAAVAPYKAKAQQVDQPIKKHASLRHWWMPPVLAVGLGAAALIGRARLFPAPDHTVRSIAVLPFTNLSEDPSQEYFSDAMTEELTSDLGNISALRVISRTSAMHYKKTAKTMPEIAREMDVDGVIEGSVVRSGDRVRITAQLIDARSDRHLWAESYERDMKDVLTLQSDLARTIAHQVRVVITPAEEERLHPEPVAPAAYEAYMQGRFYLNRWSSEDAAQALASFQNALKLNPNYALAYIGIAECYVYGVAGVSDPVGLERGLTAARRALELKPGMGEAHVNLGILNMEKNWDFAGAETEIKRGIALSPNYAPAHHWYSHLLLNEGRYDEALIEAKRLMELDPVSQTPIGHLAVTHLAMRQWDAAIVQYQLVLARDRMLTDEHSELGEAYLGKRMYPEAIAEMRRSVELSQSRAQHPLYLAKLGFAAAQSGDRDTARKIVAALPAEEPEFAAYVYAGLGDRDRSLALLDQAVKRHTFPLDAGYAIEFDSLRADPRFTSLLHRVGLR